MASINYIYIYLKYKISLILAYVYSHETIIKVKIINVFISSKNFLVLFWSSSHLHLPTSRQSLSVTRVCVAKNLCLIFFWASLVAQIVKNLPEMRETWIWSLDWEDPLEEGKATHSSILAWRIPWTEEPGGLQSVGLQRVGYDWVTKQRAHIFF